MHLAQDGNVVLRKSCDLCVRLKRACDGESPCQLCLRRQEECTRSVKKKSGPAKGTKYTTRRKRLEAGIPEPLPSKKRGSRARFAGAGAGRGRTPVSTGRKSKRVQESASAGRHINAASASAGADRAHSGNNIVAVGRAGAKGRSRRPVTSRRGAPSVPLEIRRTGEGIAMDAGGQDMVGDDNRPSTPARSLTTHSWSLPETSAANQQREAPPHRPRYGLPDSLPGILPRPPSASGVPRRGGTREPQVEMSPRMRHFHALPGPPLTKQYLKVRSSGH